MQALKKHIYDEKNGLDYILIGDYYFPVLRLPEETRPIGRWGVLSRVMRKIGLQTPAE